MEDVICERKTMRITISNIDITLEVDWAVGLEEDWVAGLVAGLVAVMVVAKVADYLQ